MNLYWVETEDHLEDWFIVAASARDAEIWFAEAEGYDDHEPTAQLVSEIKSNKAIDTGWPSQSTFDQLGASISVVSGARIVMIGDKTYREGLVDPIDQIIQQSQLEPQGS